MPARPPQYSRKTTRRLHRIGQMLTELEKHPAHFEKLAEQTITVDFQLALKVALQDAANDPS